MSFILDTLKYRYRHTAEKSLQRVKDLIVQNLTVWDDLDDALDKLQRDESREQTFQYVLKMMEKKDGIKEEPTLFEELDKAEVEDEEWETVQ
jgi:hypothetical protein